jgi:hypothetical protein
MLYIFNSTTRYYYYLNGMQVKSNSIDIIKYKNSISQRISKYQINGKLCKVYPNLKSLINEGEINLQIVIRVLKERRPIVYDNYVLLPGDGPEVIDFDINRIQHIYDVKKGYSNRKQWLLQYASTGILMNVFESIEQAARATRLSSHLIAESLRSRCLVENQLWVMLN